MEIRRKAFPWFRSVTTPLILIGGIIFFGAHSANKSISDLIIDRDASIFLLKCLSVFLIPVYGAIFAVWIIRSRERRLNKWIIESHGIVIKRGGKEISLSWNEVCELVYQNGTVSVCTDTETFSILGVDRGAFRSIASFRDRWHEPGTPATD